MTKPICKAEANWFIWRPDNPKAWGKKFRGSDKRYMRRARRRYLKRNMEAIYGPDNR